MSGLIDRAKEINGGSDGFNGTPPPKPVTRDGRLIMFGANQRPGDEQDFQGIPFDLKVFDEAAQFLEAQIRFHIGWMRDASNREQRTRAVLATNPPIDATGDWIIGGFFWLWLDITHPKPGELRYHVTAPEAAISRCRTRSRANRAAAGSRDSRTFIPAALADNPFLINNGYQAVLDGLPEPLRSARDGNFWRAP